MGMASIDIDALEDLINQLQLVREALREARQQVVDADSMLDEIQRGCDNDVLRSNMWPGMSGYVGPPLERVTVGNIDHIPNLNGFEEFAEEWEPKMRRALSLAYEARDQPTHFGPPIVTIDEDRIEA